MVNMDDGVAGLRSAQRADSLGSRVRKLVFSDGSFLDDAQLEDDNREILRLLRLPTVPEKLEGLKRLIAQSACGVARALRPPGRARRLRCAPR